jgi:hypothetical protein
VAAWTLGIPFVEVSVLPTPGQGEVARALASIEEQRGETAMHVSAAVFLLAGQCAQMRWDRNSFWFGAGRTGRMRASTPSGFRRPTTRQAALPNSIEPRMSSLTALLRPAIECIPMRVADLLDRCRDRAETDRRKAPAHLERVDVRSSTWDPSARRVTRRTSGSDDRRRCAGRSHRLGSEFVPAAKTLPPPGCPNAARTSE